MREKKKGKRCFYSTSGEDSVKIVEGTTQDLDYHINLVDKAMAGFKGMDCNFEGVLLGVKCYQTASHTLEKPFMKEESIDASNFIVPLI